MPNCKTNTSNRPVNQLDYEENISEVQLAKTGHPNSLLSVTIYLGLILM